MRMRNLIFGIVLGFVLSILVMLGLVYAIGSAEAHDTRSAIASTPWRMRPHARTPHYLPPHWRTWIRIGQCEQPGTGWKGIAWTHDGAGVTFPGGLGFTLLLAEWYRPRDAKGRMSQWTPLQQLWAAERMFYAYAKQGGQGYAATLWDCSADIGFFGFNRDGSWR